MFDLERARRETPGCENVLHFNNAGAALMPSPVLNTVLQHLQRETLYGGYEAAEEAGEALERVYGSVARLLGCGPGEVACVENATRAWDMAFYSIPFQPGDRILTAVAEYASNVIPMLQVAKHTGAKVEVIPNDESGQVSVEALRERMDARVRLIAITHVPTNGGLVNPAAEIGRVAREAGVLYLLDACQSAGQIPINVQEIGCDMFSATGRKYLRGPRGTGFLYVRKEVIEHMEPPFLDLHAADWTGRDTYVVRPDARRFENWETNIAGKLGLGIAIDYALEWGIEAIQDRVQRLADSLRASLATLPGVVVRDQGRVRCGIVTFTVDGMDAAEVRQQLAQHCINVSVSSLSSTRLDMEARKLSSVVRASVHYYNTEEEVDRFCRVLANQLPTSRL